jgi:hypothetical protein
MKICLVGAEIFQSDGQIDMKQIVVFFRNFANAPKTNQIHTIKLKYRQLLVIFLHIYQVRRCGNEYSKR